MKRHKINIWTYLDLASTVGVLKQVKRTGWILQGVEHPESVLDHSYRMAFLALVLSDEFGWNKQKVVDMCLIHDLGESVIGDIKWEHGKRVLVSPEKKHQDEKKTIRELFQNIPNKNYYISLLDEFIAQQSDEAKIVKQLDKLEMVLQAYEYEKLGHQAKKLNQFWENAEKYLAGKELGEFFNELKLKRKSNS